MGAHSFSGRGEGGGVGGGQDRARGRHLTAANALPAFRLIQPVGGGGGGGGGCCPLLADSTSGWEWRLLFAFSQFSQWGGGGGGGVCTSMLTFITGRGRHSVQKGGEGGGGATVPPAPPPPPPPPGDAHDIYKMTTRWSVVKNQ